MPTNILMPALSPTMEKGNLARWLKKEGDKIKSGDIIAEIETDKATMEYEAVDEGTLAKIVVPEGTQDVAVNAVIAVLAGEGEDVKAAAAGRRRACAASAPNPAPRRHPPHRKRGREADSAAELAGKTLPSPAGRVARRKSRRAGGKPRVEGATAFSLAARTPPGERRRHRSQSHSGSGPHGRVIARDIDAAKSGKGMRAPAPPSARRAMRRPLDLSDKQILALYEDGSYDFVPHDGMRNIIAQRLTLSKQTIPHFYSTMDCDIGKLVAAREEINAAAPDKDGKPAYKISVNDFVIKALALALQRVPDANVTWTEAGMLKHKHSDVGVAVAMPGGLITPVVRNAESKSLSAISNEMKDLAARARARHLKPQEYHGGTTSVSNLGMYGIKDFTAVINPPHSTILAVGTGEERAVVRDGKLAVATIMTVTLSTDHRAVDGALGAELIVAFKKLIENPVMMVV